MKKTLIILIVLTISIYFVLDKKLYYYGKNNFDIYNLLPLNINPVFSYDFEGGFYLEDEFGFSLISKGVHQYVGSEKKITISEIIKYGYTDIKLIALVSATDNKQYFIECIKNNNRQSKQDMIINVLDENTLINLQEYKWIEIKDDYKRIELIRNYLVIGFILMSVLIFYLVMLHFIRFKPAK